MTILSTIGGYLGAVFSRDPPATKPQNELMQFLEVFPASCRQVLAVALAEGTQSAARRDGCGGLLRRTS